jgi:hypothetical protein
MIIRDETQHDVTSWELSTVKGLPLPLKGEYGTRQKGTLLSEG